MASGTAVRHRRPSSPFSASELAAFRSLLDHQGQAVMESCQLLAPDPSTDYLGRAQAELREISDALARIDTRRYGRCDDCGEAIPAERLRDVPATPTCAGCTWKPAASL